MSHRPPRSRDESLLDLDKLPQPEPITVVAAEDQGESNVRVLRGHLDANNQRQYVQGLELASIDAVVTFWHIELWSDIGELPPGQHPQVWAQVNGVWELLN